MFNMQLNRLWRVLLSLCACFVFSIHSAPTTEPELEVKSLSQPIAQSEKSPFILSSHQHDENGFHNLSRRDLPPIIQNWQLWQEYKQVISEEIHKLTPRPIPQDTARGKDISTADREEYSFEFPPDCGERWEVTIGTPIDRGSYAAVYSGRLWLYDERRRTWSEQRQVAIKKAQLVPGNMLRGAELADQIENVYFLKPIAWFNVNTDRGVNSFLVMPQATRGNLMTMVKTDSWRSKTRREKNEVFMKILLGVQAMHRRGIMHRDLKTEDILMFESQTYSTYVPKIADFDMMTSKATSEDWHVGTPGYMAPEMIRTRRYNKAVDIFSLGMIWLNMVGLANKDVTTRLKLWRTFIGDSRESNYSPNAIGEILAEDLVGFTSAERKLLSRVLCGPSSRINIDTYIDEFSKML